MQREAQRKTTINSPWNVSPLNFCPNAALHSSSATENQTGGWWWPRFILVTTKGLANHNRPLLRRLSRYGKSLVMRQSLKVLAEAYHVPLHLLSSSFCGTVALGRGVLAFTCRPYYIAAKWIRIISNKNVFLPPLCAWHMIQSPSELLHQPTLEFESP